jgi:hypothetical protein
MGAGVIANTAAGATLIICGVCADIAGGANEAEAIAMEIEAPGYEVVAGGGGLREAPVIAVGFDEGAARGKAGELLEEQATLAATAQAEFADQLFVASTTAGGAADACEQIAVRGHKGSLDGKWQYEGSCKRLWRYHLGARLREKIVDEGCNFQTEVSNMQTKDRFGAGAPHIARASG